MLDEIQKACINIEKAREYLYLAYDKAIKNLPEGKQASFLFGDKVSAEYKNDVIRIHIQDYLPLTKYLDSNVRDRWIGRINFAIQNLSYIPPWEKIFVYIIVSAPGENWDIDNRCIKTIVDAIRYSRIIDDDNISHLAYGAEGVLDTSYYTDIYIFGYDKLEKFLREIIG